MSGLLRGFFEAVDFFNYDRSPCVGLRDAVDCICVLCRFTQLPVTNWMALKYGRDQIPRLHRSVHSKPIIKRTGKILFSFVCFGRGFFSGLFNIFITWEVLCKYWCVASTCVWLEALLGLCYLTIILFCASIYIRKTRREFGSGQMTDFSFAQPRMKWLLETLRVQEAQKSYVPSDIQISSWHFLKLTRVSLRAIWEITQTCWVRVGHVEASALWYQQTWVDRINVVFVKDITEGVSPCCADFGLSWPLCPRLGPAGLVNGHDIQGGSSWKCGGSNERSQQERSPQASSCTLWCSTVPQCCHAQKYECHPFFAVDKANDN